MYFDVHTHPDFFRKPALIREALDEIDAPTRARFTRALKRLIVLAAVVILALAYLI